jgi:hypothetical protein
METIQMTATARSLSGVGSVIPTVLCRMATAPLNDLAGMSPLAIPAASKTMTTFAITMAVTLES